MTGEVKLKKESTALKEAVVKLLEKHGEIYAYKIKEILKLDQNNYRKVSNILKDMELQGLIKGEMRRDSKAPIAKKVYKRV